MTNQKLAQEKNETRDENLEFARENCQLSVNKSFQNVSKPTCQMKIAQNEP